MVEKEREVRTEVEDCENYGSSACFLICDDDMHKDNILRLLPTKEAEVIIVDMPSCITALEVPKEQLICDERTNFLW